MQSIAMSLPRGTLFGMGLPSRRFKIYNPLAQCAYANYTISVRRLDPAGRP